VFTRNKPIGEKLYTYFRPEQGFFHNFTRWAAILRFGRKNRFLPAVMLEFSPRLG